MLGGCATEVVFDVLVRWILELIRQHTRWGDIDGAEPEWADYFEGEYLEEQACDSMPMYTAIWHNGLDNTELPFEGLNNHLESYNRAIKRRVASAKAECGRQGHEHSGLPELQVGMHHLKLGFQAEMHGNPRYQDNAVIRSDHHLEVCRNILHPNRNVQRHSGWPCARDCVGYKMAIKIQKGHCIYVVFPTSHAAIISAKKVDEAHAGAFVDMLLLRPALHRHTDFFHKWGVLATCTSDDAPTALVFSSEGYRKFAIDVVAVKWDTTERSFWQNARCTCSWFRSRKMCPHHAAVRMWRRDPLCDVRSPIQGIFSSHTLFTS